jgi:hypothetical protein
MWHDRGLAASPPVRYMLKVERSRYSPFPCLPGEVGRFVQLRAHRRDACFTAAGMGEAATSLDRRASPTMNGLRRSGQLASLPLARRLSVVPAERRGEGVRRGVAGPVGDLGEGQLAGPQVVAGEGHPPVC